MKKQTVNPHSKGLRLALQLTDVQHIGAFRSGFWSTRQGPGSGLDLRGKMAGGRMAALWAGAIACVVMLISACSESVDYKNKLCTQSNQCGAGYVCACLPHPPFEGGVCIASDIDAGDSDTCLSSGTANGGEGDGTTDVGGDGFQNDVVQADGSQNDVAANEDTIVQADGLQNDVAANEDTNKNEDVAADAGGDDIQEPKPSCDDGVTCTLDLWSLVEEKCVYLPQHDKCGDAYACTKDVCDPGSPGSGCKSTPINCAVNTTGGGDQHDPQIAPLDPNLGGGACVAWLHGTEPISYQPNVSSWVYMQCYDNSFNPLGGNIEVQSVTLKWFVRHVSIAAGPNNRVAVVWEEYNDTYLNPANGEFNKIMGRIYECDAVLKKECTPQNDPVVLSDGDLVGSGCNASAADHIWPVVVAADDGTFVVAWTVGQFTYDPKSSTGTALRVRRFGDNGPVDEAVQLGGYPVGGTACLGVTNLRAATHPDSACFALMWQAASQGDSYVITLPKDDLSVAAGTPVVKVDAGIYKNQDRNWDVEMDSEDRLFIGRSDEPNQWAIMQYNNACGALTPAGVFGTFATIYSPRIAAVPSASPSTWNLFALTYNGKETFASYITNNTTSANYTKTQISQFGANYNQFGDVTYNGDKVAAVTHAYGPDGDGVGVFLFVCDPDEPDSCEMVLPP